MNTTLILQRYVLRYPEPDMAGGSEVAASSEMSSQAAISHVSGDEAARDTPPSSTAKDLMDAYGAESVGAGELLADDADDAASDAASDAADTPQTQQEEPYALSFSEGFAPDAAFLNLVTPHCVAAGIAPDAAGKLLEQTVASMQEAEYSNMVASDAALKNDWGKDYSINKQAVESYKAEIRAKAGLSKDDMVVFNSPKGYRLLHSMMSATGAKPAAGLRAGSSSDKSWASDVMSNPNNPDHSAFHNPSDPRWGEVNSRYNSAMI